MISRQRRALPDVDCLRTGTKISKFSSSPVELFLIDEVLERCEVDSIV